MSFVQNLRALFPGAGPRLSRTTPGAVECTLVQLQVSTACPLVIVAISLADAPVLAQLIAGEQAAVLMPAGASASADGASSPVSALHLSPARQPRLSVKDPRKGWVVTVSPERKRLLSAVLATPQIGDYEVDETLALVIE